MTSLTVSINQWTEAFDEPSRQAKVRQTNVNKCKINIIAVSTSFPRCQKDVRLLSLS